MENKIICVVGLGYVGLPLAVEFSKFFKVIGFDINKRKIENLREGIDENGEIEKDKLISSNLFYTDNPEDIKKANFIIICVPTPVNNAKKPDLSYLKKASEIVGKNLSRNSIVVYESTVYPGCTEEICVPILERCSNLKYKVDFKVGYSPERINPGDKEHTIDKIVKVVSGCDKETTEDIAKVYGKIIKAGIYKAPDIKTAEAAKIIENIQRDLNIALMNELSIIFNKLGIDTKEVLKAAGTKWNFHRYYPGLVGGHCIPVDPYYLAYKAEEIGYYPEIILAGRRINENMPKYVANLVIKGLNEKGKVLKGSKVLIIGVTFKENVKDYRNSKVKDLIEELKEYGIEVLGCDPFLDNEIVEKVFGVKNYKFDEVNKVDAIVVVHLHDCMKNISLEELKNKISEKLVLVDIKNIFDKDKITNGKIIYYNL
ncbi:MAG: nucleotide sugar dehydrogenase [Candidatus Aenigmatarchaeota archaeon]|nr:MAG: nucleotide sugar dehydrogenase [Candidatus Aenigmarchaeota archaeon]